MEFPQPSKRTALRGHLAIAPADRHALQATHDVWALMRGGRACMLHLMAEAERETATTAFGDTWSALNDKAEDLNQLQLREMAQLLKTRHIVAATVTGATKYIEVLERVGVKVVVVEEAAEVLESLLLACLPSTIEHLVLVGDHEQLPPSPECHDLTVHCGFDTSLPKRLIDGGLGHVTLGRQGRMRREFVRLLRPVYPDLRTNDAAVRDNTKPECVTKSMFFWTHDVPEDSSSRGQVARSQVNTHEAWMVAAVADALVCNGIDASSITILCAYQGQVFLLRDILAGKRAVPPQNGRASTPSRQSRSTKQPKPTWHRDLRQVAVRTIDQFQGDENDVILVSLVRSNSNGRLGFLKARQRLVVAASRARNGLYFFGNPDTLRRSSHWKQLLDTMASQGCVGNGFPIMCARHPPAAASEASTPATNGYHEFVRLRCTKVCGAALSGCQHTCSAQCHSGNHPQCDRPCARKRECGHPCAGKCGEQCALTGECLACKQAEVAARAAELAAKAAEVQAAVATAVAEAEKLAREQAVVALVSLDAKSSEYVDVQRLVESSCQPEHGQFITVASVTAVRNTKLQSRWLAAKAKLLDPLAPPSRKFHGTRADAAERIAKDGFKLPPSRASTTTRRRLMFGRGVYFASDSSKSAQHTYTRGECTLLVCDVLLGKPRPVITADYDADNEAKRTGPNGYDSVYAVPNTRDTGGVLFDEFVVYNPAQALPLYIVKFQLRKFDAISRLQVTRRGTYKKTVVIDGATQSAAAGDDPALDLRIRLAESQFYRMMQGQPGRRVVKVEALFNSDLEAAFERVKRKAKAAGGDGKTIYAFHGTPEANINKIHAGGFKIGGAGVGTANGAAHGHGVYLATCPTTSMDYTAGANMMFMVEVVLGKASRTPQTQAEVHQPRVMHYHPLPGVYVAFSAAQVIPRFVVHYQ